MLRSKCWIWCSFWCLCSGPLGFVKNLQVTDPTTSTLNVRWEPAEGNVREYIVIWVPAAGGDQDVVRDIHSWDIMSQVNLYWKLRNNWWQRSQTVLRNSQDLPGPDVGFLPEAENFIHEILVSWYYGCLKCEMRYVCFNSKQKEAFNYLKVKIIVQWQLKATY